MCGIGALRKPTGGDPFEVPDQEPRWAPYFLAKEALARRAATMSVIDWSDHASDAAVVARTMREAAEDLEREQESHD